MKKFDEVRVKAEEKKEEVKQNDNQVPIPMPRDDARQERRFFMEHHIENMIILEHYIDPMRRRFVIDQELRDEDELVRELYRGIRVENYDADLRNQNQRN